MQSRKAVSHTGLLRKEGQEATQQCASKVLIALNIHTKHRNQILYLIWSKILAKQCGSSEVLLKPKTLMGHEGYRDTKTR